MTGLGKYPLWPGIAKKQPRVAGPSVEVLSHAARYLHGRPPSADVVVLQSADAVTPFRAEIDALAASCADRNTQFESVTLGAAMDHLQKKDEARVALLWSEPDGTGRRLMIGLAPYFASRGSYGSPFAIWHVWEHIHSFISTPLLRAGYEQQAVRRFLAFAAAQGAALVEFPMFEAGGAFDNALRDVMAADGILHRETDRHERALLRSELDEEAYLAANIRKKKRKEFNRLWNRLAEEGRLEFAVHDGGSDVGTWVDRFLTLEARGWKGKRGTAMKMRANERAYFEEICRGAYEAGTLHCTELTLDGNPVAMLTSFRSGRGVFTFKIAFDERYARYSPGTLLMLKAIGVFLRDDKVDWVDSCAVPGHPMIDHIWAERRTMSSMLVTTPHPFSVPLAGWIALAKRGEAAARKKLRVLYDRLQGDGNEQAD
jgi:CelD/BcsL family acetyltransferase involved in cellulose biosynthesis